MIPRSDALAARLAQVRARIDAAARLSGRSGDEVELLFAGKYVPVEELRKLAEAGVTLIGENRAQELEAKVAVWGERFTWDFIGQLQSRKVKAIVPHVRLIHTLASESAARALAREAGRARPGLEALIEVNVAREEGKGGVVPEQIDALAELCPVAVTGLMTMPPGTGEPEESRRWFASLRELAHARGLTRLSMGTSQDYAVAVEEGATIVRLGRSLLA
ncbi:MAG: YggS family pyridoxal phosphate-dependent enzyme [Solirubrobacteraceae bacterium]